MCLRTPENTCHVDHLGGSRPNIKTVVPVIGISIIKIRLSWDSLIFTMVTSIPTRLHIYIEADFALLSVSVFLKWVFATVTLIPRNSFHEVSSTKPCLVFWHSHHIWRSQGILRTPFIHFMRECRWDFNRTEGHCCDGVVPGTRFTQGKLIGTQHTYLVHIEVVGITIYIVRDCWFPEKSFLNGYIEGYSGYSSRLL